MRLGKRKAARGAPPPKRPRAILNLLGCAAPAPRIEPRPREVTVHCKLYYYREGGKPVYAGQTIQSLAKRDAFHLWSCVTPFDGRHRKNGKRKTPRVSKQLWRSYLKCCIPSIKEAL
jgi:hypothetical protein